MKVDVNLKQNKEATAGPAQKILRGQNLPIFAAQVAYQNAGFTSFCPPAVQPYINKFGTSYLLLDGLASHLERRNYLLTFSLFMQLKLQL